jgi:hypothetical protein
MGEEPNGNLMMFGWYETAPEVEPRLCGFELRFKFQLRNFIAVWP